MSTDTLPATGGRRRQERQRRRRQRRQRLVAGAVALAVLFAVAVVLAVRGGDEPGPAAPVETGARTQRTLLLQLEATSGVTVSNVLLATDPADGSASALLVPSPVLATPPGSSAAPFDQVLRTTSVEATRNALADLIGVTVDASWVVTGSELVGLIDQLGGVTAEVDVQVLGGEDGRQILLSPGPQQLTGRQAVTFSGYLADGEPEQARLARLQRLLDGVLAQLPADLPGLRGRLDGLGAGSRLEGLDTRGLAAFLTALRTEDLAYDTLPVVPLETGAQSPSLRLDPEPARAVVDRLLAASVPAGAREGGNRVKVFNGVGTPMLGATVRDRLVTAGLVYVPGGNASRFGIATTEIQIGEPTAQTQALGQRVAVALGVPATAVRSSAPTTVAEVVVVVGADFPAG